MGKYIENGGAHNCNYHQNIFLHVEVIDCLDMYILVCVHTMCVLMKQDHVLVTIHLNPVEDVDGA